LIGVSGTFSLTHKAKASEVSVKRMMTDVYRDKAARLLKKSHYAGSIAGTSSSSEHINMKHPKKAGSVSTLSFAEERSRDASLQPGTKIENTYRMQPSRSFPSGQVQLIIRQLLEKYLEHEQYKPELCRQMSKSLSEVIRARVKDLMVPRYKIVCLVHIGQLGEQCIRIGSRCLWDSSCDTFASYEFKNSSLFAVCTVYAVYAE
jgi:hypothetical protein